MKVLVLLSSLDLGGSMISAIELAGAVRADQGWEVVVYAPDGPARGLLAERDLRWVEAPPPGFTASPRLARHLAATITAERPDLVHAWDFQQLNRAYYLAHLRGRPVIGSCTAMSVPALLPWALPISFVTEEIRDQDRRRGRAYLQEYPINIGLDDPMKVDGDGFRRSLGVGDEQVLLVVVSRLARWMKREGIVRTIEVVGELAGDHDLVLAVVGDGDAREELEALGASVNRAAGRDVVRFTGAATDPRPAYAGADISLGMGTSIVRAMAFGRPGVVLGEDGFAETFTPDSADLCCSQGFYGLAERDGANERLKAQLEVLIREPELRHKLGDFSRELVTGRFSSRVVAADLAQRYGVIAATRPDRSIPVLARAAAQGAFIAAAEPVKGLVPQQVKYWLQRRDNTRNAPLQGVPRP